MAILGTHFISQLRSPQRRVTSVGICIYCERQPPEVALEDEHIFPDGLGGDLILPQASCRDCAGKINRFESRTINETFGAVRMAHGQRSRKRRKSGRPDRTFVLGDGSEDMEAAVNREVELRRHPESRDMPYGIFLPLYGGEPGLLGTGGDSRQASLGVFFPPDLDARIAKINESGDFSMINSIEGTDLPRLVAKISYAFAVAVLGLEAFRPLLRPFILGHETNWAPYVGLSAVRLERPTESYHLVALKEKRLNSGDQAVVAFVQFYGTYRTPLYEAVVGLLT